MSSETLGAVRLGPEPGIDAAPNAAQPIEPDRRWLRAFAKTVCYATLFLIFMGGLVTSHDAGLSVVDWPTSGGYNMFTYPLEHWLGAEHRGFGDEGVFWEHSHRLFASLVGVLTLILAAWIVARDKRFWLWLLAFGAVFLVTIQGILGGMTVLLGLPTQVSVLHGVAGQSFLVVLLIIAYALSKERRERRREADPGAHRSVRRWAIAAVSLVFIQLLVAAVMRHSGAGLAIPDFPTTAGTLIPSLGRDGLEWVNAWREAYSARMEIAMTPVTLGQMHIHFLHRLLAVVIVAAVVGLNIAALRHTAHNARVLRSVYILDALVLLQFTLGILSVWTVREPFLTSAHVVVGAALLAWTTIVALRSLPVGVHTTPSELEAASA